MTTLNLMKMAESSLKWWKTLGKGEIASFFMVFSEEFYCRHVKQEGHDGPVSLHWLIREIHSYQTLHYLGIGLKHKTPYKD